MEKVNSNKKRIYIVHQYLIKSHFKALYDEAIKYDYEVYDYIVLSKMDIFRRIRNELRDNKSIIDAFKIFLHDFGGLFRLRLLKNQVLIVGIAPYDTLLNKYHKVFKKNNSIYFTSWQFWDGTNFPEGSIENKNTFETLLKTSFKGAACVSKVTEKCMRRYFSNTSVVNHAININKYSTKIVARKEFKIKKFLYLGQLIERKNIGMIIDWINQSKDLNFQFSFAGKGNMVDKIISLDDTNDRVNYLGQLSKSEIQNVLKNYDFLVLPSREEPFGIVLIEALAAGVPCIVSNALGPREIIKDNNNGYVFNVDDKDEFFYKMNCALNMNLNQYSIMHSNALRSSEKYDSTNLIKEWIKVIDYEDENRN